MTNLKTAIEESYKTEILVTFIQENEKIKEIKNGDIYFYDFNLEDKKIESFAKFMSDMIQKCVFDEFQKKYDIYLNHVVSTSGITVGKPKIQIILAYMETDAPDNNIIEFINNIILYIAKRCVDNDLFDGIDKIPTIDEKIEKEIDEQCKEYLVTKKRVTHDNHFSIEAKYFKRTNIGSLHDELIEGKNKPRRIINGTCVFMGYSKKDTKIELKIVQCEVIKVSSIIKVTTEEYSHFYRRPLEEEKGYSHHFEIEVIGDIKDKDFKLISLTPINMQDAANDDLHDL